MQSRAFPAFLMSMSLAACTSIPPEDRGLRVEDRPGEGVIRISNPSRKTARVYYYYKQGWGHLQMFHVRFRDSEQRIIDPNYGGWYTPLSMTSDLYGPGEYGPRKPLVIRGGSFIDLKRDLDALTHGLWTRTQPAAPCAMQIRLSVFGERWTYRRVNIEGAWQPAPCPRLYVEPILPPAAKTR